MRILRNIGWAIAPVCALCSLALISPIAHAQATVGTGNIQGTVLDPKNATVSTAKVLLTSKGYGNAGESRS